MQKKRIIQTRQKVFYKPCFFIYETRFRAITWDDTCARGCRTAASGHHRMP